MIEQHQSTLEKRLVIAAAVTGVIVIAEVAGGILSNSLALLSDSGHAFADTVGLLLALLGVRQARRERTPSMTFGYHRVSILMALLNAALLVVMAGTIIFQALRRLQNPQPVEGLLMFSIAIVGLAVNLTVAFLLHPFQSESLGVRGALLNVLGDLLGSVAVILGGIVIALTGFYLVDPAASLLIAGLLAFGAMTIIRDGFRILLEASPRGLPVEEMLEALQKISGVKGVHDLHVWSITHGIEAVSCHIQVDEVSIHDANRIRERVVEVLRNQYDIAHSTLQLECEHTGANDIHCSVILGAGDKKGGDRAS